MDDLENIEQQVNEVFEGYHVVEVHVDWYKLVTWLLITAFALADIALLIWAVIIIIGRVHQ